MDFIVYSKPACPQCDQAKQLIARKGKMYKEVVIDVGQARKESVEYINVTDLKSKYPNVRMAPVITDSEGGFIGSLPELKSVLA